MCSVQEEIKVAAYFDTREFEFLAATAQMALLGDWLIFLFLGGDDVSKYFVDAFFDLFLVHVYGIRQLHGYEPHGLFQESALSKGEFLVFTNEEKFFEDVCDIGKIATLELFRILTVATVPVLACVAGELGTIFEGFEDSLANGGGAHRAQPNVYGICNRNHQGYVVAQNANNIKIGLYAADFLGLNTLNASDSLGGIYYQLINLKHLK